KTVEDKFMLFLMRLSRISLVVPLFFGLGLPQILSSPDLAIAQVTTTTTPALKNIPPVQASKIIFIAPNGSDSNSGVSIDQPLRSLTAAIKKNLQAGAVIQVASGNYTADTGEVFPIKLPAGVTLRGDSSNQGKDIIISGGGVFVSPTFARQNIALLVGDGARIDGITLTNSNPRGYALWVESAQNVIIANNTFTRSTHDGVFLTGATTANVTGNIFTQNGANGISALGTSSGQIQFNTFDNTGFGLAIGQKSQVAVLSNRIINNRGGVVVSNLSTPSFRNNLIANNQENGLVILKDRNGQPNVDLGTTTNPGQNIFQNNKQADINNASGVTVVAIGNQADPKRIQGSVNLVQPTSPLTPPSTPATPTAQVAFNDVPSSYWAQTFIQELATRNIIKGFPDGSFRPNDPVTRAQFAAILSQSINKSPIRSSTDFVDLPSTYWATPAIQKAYTIGFMSGYPGSLFKPNENIQRVQILVALANGLSFAPAKPIETTLQTYSDATVIPSYARSSVAAATENNLVVNYPNIKFLNPTQPATRAEVAAFVYQALVRSGQIQAINSPYIVNK
ncbi:MAG: S-layer homology domain-containing protein, partial [Pseudanabaena sp. ELA748]